MARQLVCTNEDCALYMDPIEEEEGDIEDPVCVHCGMTLEGEE